MAQYDRKYVISSRLFTEKMCIRDSPFIPERLPDTGERKVLRRTFLRSDTDLFSRTDCICLLKRSLDVYKRQDLQFPFSDSVTVPVKYLLFFFLLFLKQSRNSGHDLGSEYGLIHLHRLQCRKDTAIILFYQISFHTCLLYTSEHLVLFCNLFHLAPYFKLCLSLRNIQFPF